MQSREILRFDLVEAIENRDIQIIQKIMNENVFYISLEWPDLAKEAATLLVDEGIFGIS